MISFLMGLAFVLTLIEAFCCWWGWPATRPHLGWLGVAVALLAWILSSAHLG